MAAVFAVSLGVVLEPLAPAQAANIAPPTGPAPDFRTAFEIDGNKPVDGVYGPTSIDWNSLLTFNPATNTFTAGGTTPPYSLPATGTQVAVQSTGIIQSAGSTDLDQSGGLCTGSNDLTAFPGSVTINDYPWGDNTGIANVNNKSDACTGAAAWEIVRVRSADGTYDQNHYIYYQYWARSFDATGEVTVFQAFSDNKLPGNCGDFMVAFDYNSSTKDVENFRTYQWNDQTPDPNCSGAGSWSVAQPAITAGDGAAGFNPDVVPAGQIANDGTFGESAIDLTSAGVLTGETCQTFTAGDVVLKTGQADGAQLIDLMHMPPIQISNCNQVDVQKTSATGVDTDDVFSYKIAQRDGLTVHDATRTGTLLPSGPAVTDTDASVNSITANITIGDTHRWSNVLAQPDYFVDELAPLPPGWQLQSIVCTYQDAFLPGKPVQTATIFPVQNPVQSFKVFPPQLGLQVPKCVITNVANTVTIVKDAQPNTAGTFSFGASLDGVAQPGFGLVDDGSGVGNSKTFVVSQRASGNFDSFFEIGADNPPFYEFDSVLCLEAGQQVGGPGDAQVTLNTSADPNQPGVDIRIAPGAPRNITCTFANKQTLQPYQIIVTPGVATNRLTDAHTFFVELRTDSDDDKAIDDPVIGATLNLTWSGPAGSAINQVNGVNVAPTPSTTCTTVAPLPPRIGGVCQVRVSSPTNVGTGSLLASYAIPSGEASDPDLPSGVDKGTTALNPTTSGGVITNYTGVEDVERIQAAGQKTWVGYLVDVEPDGTNPLNQDHTFTVTVDRTDGVTPTDAAGVTVNLTWNPGTATGSTIKTVDVPGVIQPGGLTATCITNASGVCQVTVQDGDVQGTGTLTVNSVAGDLIGQGPRTETPIPGSDLTGTKTWVAHRVFVTETDTNAVGQPHTFSVLAQIDNGTGFVDLTSGTVDVTWNPGTASGSVITGAVTGTVAGNGLSATCDLAAANPCLVTVNSATDFGTGTLTATTLHATVGLPGDFPVINAGNSASKTWVQFRTSVAATDTNLSGEPHTFTITADYVDDSGAPDALPVPDGTTVNFTFIGTGTVTHVNGAPAPGATSCVTTGGSCTVTVLSSTPGSGTITVTGIAEVVVDGDQLAPGDVVLSATTIPGGSQTAVKTWARYSVDVSDDATNLLGDDHVFTITVRRDTGSGAQLASGVTVDYSWVGPDGSTASPTTACVTDLSGTCTVTVDSNTSTGAGTLTVTGLGTSEGAVSVTYADTTTGTPNPANGLDPTSSDGRGVKQWWAYDVDISADDANLAGQSHTFTVTARVDKGDGLGLVPVADGAHVTASTNNSGGNGAIVGTGDGGAQTTCLTSPGTGAGTVGGACSIVVDGTQPGATTVTVTSLVVDGFTVDLTAANADHIGWSAEFSGPVESTKYWVQYRVNVTPNTAENPLSVEHVFTITVETTINGTDWVPAADGTLVDFDWNGPAGSTEVPADTCTIAGGLGQCTVTVDSDTNPGPGTLTVTGIRNSSVVTPDGTLVVPSADLTAAGALYLSAESDRDGTKTWAGYKVVIVDDGRNPRNFEHEFTVTLYKTTDAAAYAAAAGETDDFVPTAAWSPVSGADIGLAWTGEGEITDIVVGTIGTPATTGTCTTNAGGQCAVTVDNPTAGSGTLTVTSLATAADENIPAYQTDNATKTWIGFDTDITGDATNPAGRAHTFVVTAEVIDGEGGTVSPAPDGTIVGFTVEAGATADLAASTCDNGTTDGTCTIVVNSTTPGTYTVTVTSLTFAAGNGVIDEPLDTPISLTVDEQSSADKTYRRYRITTEDDATNLAGEDHLFTFTVEYTENGSVWDPLVDSTVQFATTDPAAVTLIETAGIDPLTCITDSFGQCDVTVSSADTGSVTVSVVSITDTLPTGLPAPDDTKTWVLAVTDTTAVLSTDSATKTWIAFDVDITPATATNRVDDAHTFTITVRVDPGTGTLVPLPVDAVNGGTVDWSFVGPDGPDSGTCTLVAGGTCDVVLNSSTPGLGTITAEELNVVFGGEAFGPIDLTAAADGQATELTVPPTADKTWIEIFAEVEASAINLAGEDHTFTLSAYYDDGNGVHPANGASFDFSWTGAEPAVPASPCVALPTENTCEVTVTSDVGAQGTITVDSVTLTVNGVTFSDEVPVAADGGSLAAVKTWIAYRVIVTPAAADNLTGQDHIMHVYVQADIGGGFLPLEGAVVTFTFPGAGGAGSVTDGATEIPPGSGTYQCTTVDPDPVPGDPACEITVSSAAAGTGTLTVTQIASPVIGGLVVPIANVDVANTYIADDSVVSGTKTWHEFRVVIEEDGTNPLGQEHPFTITVSENSGTGFAPVAGVTVTYGWDGPTGSTITASPCVTDGSGQCNITVDSDTNPGLGRVTVTQLSTLPDGLPAIDVTYANGTTETPNAADGLATGSDGRAVKVWAQYRVRVTPPADSNLTGEPHTFTLTAEKRTDSGDWATDPDVGTIVFTWDWAGEGPAPALTGATLVDDSVSPPVYECATVAGVCEVSATSDAPGTGTISVLSVDDVEIDGLVTDSIQVEPVNATKTWVEYRVDVSDDAVNLLGDEHDFTITVTKNSGSGFAPIPGVTVDYSWSGPAGSTFDPPSPCVTDAAGACVVTVDSDTATGDGTLQVDGLSDLSHNGIDLSDIDLTYSGGTDVPNATDGLDAAGSDGQGVKSWWAYDVDITGDDANLAGQSHVFTVTATVYKGEGATAVADGATVTVDVDSPDGDGAVVATGDGGEPTTCLATPPGPGTGAGTDGGACTIVVDGTMPGSTTITVTSLSVDGFVVDLTDQNADGVGVDASFDGPVEATKYWVQYRVDVTPDAADNPLDVEHEMTITVDTTIDGENWLPASDGTTVTFDWDGPAGSTATPPSSCTLTGGSCSVIVDSSTNPGTGTLTVTAISGATVVTPDGTLAVPPATITGVEAYLDVEGSDITGSKTWWGYKVIVELDGVNPRGTQHVFTVTLWRTDDPAAYADAAGTDEATFDPTGWSVVPDAYLAVEWSGPNPPTSLVSVVTDAGDVDVDDDGTPETDVCVTNGSGQCTATVTSSAPSTGQLTVTHVGLVDDSGQEPVSIEVPVFQNDDATKTWLGFDTTITGDAVNPAGEDHTFTVSVSSIDGVTGTGGHPVPDGTIVGYMIVDDNGDPVVAEASSTCDTGTVSSTCTIVVSSDVPGTLIVSVTSLTFNDGEFIDLPEGEESLVVELDASEQSSADKTFRAYRVRTEADSVNIAGQSHEFTFWVEYTENGTDWLPLQGSTVQFAATDASDVSSIVPAGAGALTCATGALGTCDVTVMSATAGSVTVSVVSLTDTLPTGLPDPATETFTIPVSNTTAVLSTDTATKTWVQYRVTVEADGENLVGEDHPFTILVEYTDGTIEGEDLVWQPADGADVSYTWTGTGAIAPPSPCTTDVDGECNLTASSAVTGTGTLTVTGLDVSGMALDLDGGTSITVSYPDATTESPTAQPALSDDSDGRATKTWIDYRVTVNPPTAENLVATEHTFTVTVEKDSGDGEGFQPLDGATPDITVTGVGSLVDETCSEPGTDATGECEVTITSAATGVTTVTADFEGTAADSESETFSDNGVKQWVDHRITVTPEAATNDANDPHTFTVLLERDTGGGFAPFAGQTVQITASGTGAITAIVAGTVATAQSGSCVTSAAGTCDVTVNSPVAGSLTIAASYGAAVGGTSRTYTDSGTKTWESADLAIQKSASVTTAERSGTFNWVLDVQNNGPDEAVNVVVSDTVPAPFVVTGVTSAQFNCSTAGNAVTCTRPSLAVGATGQVVIAVSTPADAPAGTITNIGSVQATTPDPNLANNTDDASVQIPEIVVQPPPPPVLPRTGADGITTLVRIAVLLLAAGFVVWGIGRRRTADDAR